VSVSCLCLCLCLVCVCVCGCLCVLLLVHCVLYLYLPMLQVKPWEPIIFPSKSMPPRCALSVPFHQNIGVIYCSHANNARKYAYCSHQTCAIHAEGCVVLQVRGIYKCTCPYVCTGAVAEADTEFPESKRLRFAAQRVDDGRPKTGAFNPFSSSSIHACRYDGKDSRYGNTQCTDSSLRRQA